MNAFFYPFTMTSPATIPILDNDDDKHTTERDIINTLQEPFKVMEFPISSKLDLVAN
jgi:hypothetical protein